MSLLVLLAIGTAHAQPQTKDQRKCTGAMNGALAQIGSRIGKQTAACIKSAAKGELTGDVDACLATDPGGKIGDAVGDGEEKFTKLCTGTSRKDPASPKRPPYGVTDPATVQAAALQLQLDLVHDAFGADLDAAIVREDTDRDASKCQQNLVKRVNTCAATRLQTFNACKGAGLKDESAPFDGREDLEGCLGQDPKGKIAKQCDKLEAGPSGKVDAVRKALDRKCLAKGVSLAAAIPGCGTDDLEQAHACLDAASQCRVCLALNRADALARDCDAFDDGVVNESCVPPFVIGRHECTLTDQTSGFIFETGAFFDIFTLNGAVDLECGVVDPLTGTTSCTCTLTRLDPVPIVPGLAVACVRATGGCPPGEISCNGGGQYNSAVATMHSIGACTGNADCAAQCAATCTALSAAARDSGCEGFCRDGASAGAACTTDASCPGGTCNGLDGAPHGNVCQCECLDRAGPVSPPGGLQCHLGLAVEVETAAPCGDGDVLFRVGPRCIELTTETTTATIVDANNVAGEQIPSGEEINGGLGVPCAQLATGGTSGMFLVAPVNVLDVETAGDIAFTFLLGCE